MSTGGRIPKTESASSDGHIEWEATPPPELSDSAAHDIDNTESARKRVRFPDAVGIGEKSLVTNGYKGDLTDKIPGKQSPSVIMSPSGASHVFGPAPSSQRTLDIRHTKSAESRLAPVPGLQSDERPLSHMKDAYFHEFLLFLQSKNLGSVTPAVLKRSHVPDSSMCSSGDSYGEAATEGSAGLIATSVSNDDRDGHNRGSGNRDGSHPTKPRRSLRSTRATTIPAAPPSQAVLEEYNILHVDKLPDVDETFNTKLQDPLLAASYPDLPNLYAVTMRT
ncbi:hypothetical protein C8J57DRAFT_1401360 [Mycena rebaudengoi]|nr:hypothetical protein C8J57DRAFT_1401360 [Mycena rebaudengoi]